MQQQSRGFWNNAMSLGFITMLGSWVGFAPYTVTVGGVEPYIAALTWLGGLVTMVAGTAFALVALVASRKVSPGPAAAEDNGL